MTLATHTLRLQGQHGIWNLGDRLVDGPSGSVHLATGMNGTRAIVKVLAPNADRALRARFRREREALARLDHPRIPRLLDAAEADATDDWLVLTVAPGRPLGELIASGPLSAPVYVAVAEQIGDALAHAHARGVLHRDLSPSNIVVDGTAAYLLDFGLTAIDTGPEVTVAGAMLGTLAYCAPEQLEGQETGPSSDVYGLAACLFAALTGAPPHPGATATDILRRRTLGVRLQLAPGTDAARPAVALLEAALADDPAARPQSIAGWSQELADTLAALEEPMARHFVAASTDRTVTSGHSTPGRRWRRTAAVGVGLGLAAVTAAGLTSSDRVARQTTLRTTPDRVTLPVGWTAGAPDRAGRIRAIHPQSDVAVLLYPARAAVAPKWTTARARRSQMRGQPLLKWEQDGRARLALLGTRGATVIECTGTTPPDLGGTCRDLLTGSTRSDRLDVSITRVESELRAALKPTAAPWRVPPTDRARHLRARARLVDRGEQQATSVMLASGLAWLPEFESLGRSLRQLATALRRFAEAPSPTRRSAAIQRARATRAASARLRQVLTVPLPAIPRVDSAAKSMPTRTTVTSPSSNSPASSRTQTPSAVPTATGTPAPAPTKAETRKDQETKEPAEAPIVVGPDL